MAINRHRLRTFFNGTNQQNLLMGVVPPEDGTVTDGVDGGYDSPTQAGYTNFIVMWIDGGNANGYSIQGIPIPDHKEIFPMFVKSTGAGTFTIELYEIENDFIGVSFIIYDKELDIYWDVNVEGEYTFTVDSAVDTKDRIYLYARVMPTHKKHRMPVEISNLLFSSAQPSLIKDYNNAITTVQYISEYTPKNKEITTATYDINWADRNHTIIMNNAGANTVTIPADSSIPFDIGTVINIINKGAGVTTIAITTDTLNNNIGGLTMAQYDKRTLRKIGTTEWILSY